jgi:pheromone shutdown protein TraB
VTEALSELEDGDIIETLLIELGKQMPSLMGPLLEERNAYMVNFIRHAPGRVVVVVVGRAHLQGMIKLWNEPIDSSPLLVVPSSWLTFRRFLLCVVTVFVVFFGLILSWLIL